MVKILIINPIIREENDPKHLPYGQALMAAIAIKEGHQVQFLMPMLGARLIRIYVRR